MGKLWVQLIQTVCNTGPTWFMIAQLLVKLYIIMSILYIIMSKDQQFAAIVCQVGLGHIHTPTLFIPKLQQLEVESSRTDSLSLTHCVVPLPYLFAFQSKLFLWSSPTHCPLPRTVFVHFQLTNSSGYEQFSGTKTCPNSLRTPCKFFLFGLAFNNMKQQQCKYWGAE